jgi:hypothetical protein
MLDHCRASYPSSHYAFAFGRFNRFESDIRRLLLAAILLFFTVAAEAVASDEPFTGPANWGGTGLMETPTARVMKEDTYRIGGTQASPYRWYYGAISPWDRIEIDGRVTEVLGVKALQSGYGNTKDKAIDFKFQTIREGKYMPAVALGIMDPHGTRLYSSQYLVASKQIYPFDFTLGFGNGRYGKRPLPSQGEGFQVELFTDPRGWLKDVRPFGGIQFCPTRNFSFMAEYSPIRYEKQINDPAQPKYFRRSVASPFNFGIRYKPISWAEIALSYQRGEEIGLSLAFAFDIGTPLVPLYNPTYKENKTNRTKSLDERIAIALNHLGFSDIAIRLKGDELWVQAENDKYLYPAKAVGVMLKVVTDMAPETVESCHVILTENRIPMFQFTALRSDLVDFYADRMSLYELLALSRIDTTLYAPLSAPLFFKRPFTYGLKPSVETLLNDPSGFFKYRLGLAGWIGYHPVPGGALLAGLEAYPVNNISSSNAPSTTPVRSDLVLYKQENVTLGRLMYEQTGKTGKEFYWRGSFGYLEIEYAGFDAEVARPFRDGRLLFSVGGSAVRKRDVKNVLKLKENDWKSLYTTAFLNTRINFPEHDITLDIKAGRFLAGDWGTRITVSKFIKGVKIFAWYSFTDTSIFKDSYDRGYHDKGIGVQIPMRIFEGADSRTVYNYSLAPWTRDVAQDIDHYTNLFDLIGRRTKTFIRKDAEMLQ